MSGLTKESVGVWEKALPVQAYLTATSRFITIPRRNGNPMRTSEV